MKETEKIKIIDDDDSNDEFCFLCSYNRLCIYNKEISYYAPCNTLVFIRKLSMILSTHRTRFRFQRFLVIACVILSIALTIAVLVTVGHIPVYLTQPING